jgi:hypothetical protein
LREKVRGEIQTRNLRMTIPDNKYAAMSRDYMQRAEGYLRQGDLAQASEKSWGATACALKAIAEQRGWQHQSHSLLFDLPVKSLMN